jgi:hypothetical protein
MRTPILLVAVVVLGCPAVQSGEPARKAEGAPVFTGRPEKHYVEAGRVDPFTIAKLVAEPPDPEPPEKPEELKVPYERIAGMLTGEGDERFDRCLAECCSYIPKVEAEIAELGAEPGKAAEELARMKDLLEKLTSLKATAGRLKRRRAIEREFAALDLTITGIVARRRGKSTAVIGGEMVREGQVLKLGGREVRDLSVRRIRARTVRFLYRGVEVELKLKP